MTALPSRRAERLAPRGFTLVELLVVIAVIGVLLAILLPAVQAAREAARRMTCANHLHQIGVGMHAHHESRGSFPPGGIEMVSRQWPKGRQLAWSAFLLPYLEEQTLYDRIDFSKSYSSSENAEAAAQIVPTYVCPSVPRKSYLRKGRGACDYGGIYGERIVSTNNPPRGAMIYDQAIRLRDIIDGASRTLMIAEDSESPDGQWINAANVFDVSGPINAAKENDIRAKHPRGANGLFVDGSVHFLVEELDKTVLAAICTRNGNEPVADFGGD
jgi:prepilin-type N-terminal cleavage/methylation domain-containing protein/prepilin-type processing-associated H-X9-DG protein